MKRMLLVILAGIAAGVVAHFGWYGAHRPARGDNLDAQLAWMQESLQLSPAQFARIKLLHEQSSPRLLALAGQVGRMQEEFAAFERERRIVGQIDFLEFARFVEQRRAVDRECAESTRGLILATSAVMTPEQRARYLAMLDPALKATGTSSLN